MNNSKTLQESINRFLPILMEVRKRIMFVFAFFIIFALVGFFNYERIILFLINLLDVKELNIVFTSPFQFLNLAISSSITIGLIATAPILVHQFLTFLKPALKRKEYRSVISMIPVAVILFVMGFIFGFIMMKYVVDLFYHQSLSLNIGNVLDISKLLTQILVTSALMGIAFQFPVVISLLIKFNIIRHQVFIKYRPVAYIIAIIFAALMPPTDILSMILLALPLVFLFEITLLLNKIFDNKKGKEVIKIVK